ncbi:ROK family transcriptional regulator [Motilibacter rhizosphaerae]|uniref:ROK family transcriptional regulator n=1 Tax=Motilibacter rhizosphaerae TaxID=598652 RepID=UPI00102BF9C4|nr:ROK family transcriptional regulator [Motilibacter rhizosphaerae]
MATHDHAAARVEGVRRRNLALAVRVISAEPGPVSRAHIAARTGMTRSTASSLVDDLVGAGFVQETGTASRTGSGRPATTLELATHRFAGLGIEVNVDYLAASLLDLSGTVRHRASEARDLRGSSPEDVLGHVGEIVEDVAAEARRQDLELVGACLAVPGLVGPSDGHLTLAPNLGWEDVDLVPRLERMPALAGLELRVGNEANLAALTERTAIRDRESFVYVSGEIGVGAAVVIDGRVSAGRHGWAGEIGHNPVDLTGPSCSCGGRGCLEQYAGLDAILRASGSTEPLVTPLGGESTTERIVARARSGDMATRRALQQAGSALGVVLAGTLNVLDLDRVVLGGTYRVLAPWVSPPLEEQLSSRVIGARWSPVRVGVASVPGEAPVLGAALSVVDRVLADPLPWVERERRSPQVRQLAADL